MAPDIFGAAITDYFHNPGNQKVKVHSPNFEDDEISVAHLFRTYTCMPKLEQVALKLCKGHVLDIGCGAGSHSLYLQQQTSCKVSAIDISTGAIQIATSRGLANAAVRSFYDYDGQSFDTLLLLMNGAGIIGTLSNTETFFSQVRKQMQPNGQLLLDSSDISYIYKEEDGGFWIDTTVGYYGEIRYKISYKDQESSWFDWLFIDFHTLKCAAQANGFSCELVYQGIHQEYLARIILQS